MKLWDSLTLIVDIYIYEFEHIVLVISAASPDSVLTCLQDDVWSPLGQKAFGILTPKHLGTPKHVGKGES